MAERRKPISHTWRRRKHAKKVVYRTGSRPRDIAGAFEKQVPHYNRDRAKFLGTKTPRTKELALPPKPTVFPKNQGLRYYLERAVSCARAEMFGNAYWYFMRVAELVFDKNRPSTRKEKDRYEASALSNLKSYYKQIGEA